MKMNHQRASKPYSQSKPNPSALMKAIEAGGQQPDSASVTSDGVDVDGMVGNRAIRDRPIVCYTLGGDKSVAIDALKIEASTSAISDGAVVYRNFDYLPATQQSAPIALQANQKYYIEVLHKDGSGSEHVEVAWKRPGGSREIIPSQYLSSYVKDPNDQDDDGLLDSWETANGLSATDNGRINGKNGALGDPDHDGLTNLQEYQQGSNPNSSTQSREEWTYDAVGNVATYTTRGGQVKTCTFDDRNRELTCNWSDSTPDVTMTYDDASRLLTMSSSVSALSYTYNDANQMLTETQDINSPVDLSAKTVSYTYNNSDGLRDGMNYPGGTALTYTFTNRNQLKDIVSGGNNVATYAYDLNGSVATKTLINGTLATYTYDNASRLTNVAHTKSGANLIANAYTLNSVGNRTARSETVGSNSAKTDKYGFDPTDQLTDVKYNRNDGAGSHDRQTAFAYDAVGNRVTMNEDADGSASGSVVTTPYSANALNQYTAIDGLATPAYDNRGNITTLQTETGGPTWTYGYDAQNRLISVSGTNGVTASFAYDARNRCVARTVSSSMLLFVWDDWNLLDERNTSDAVQAYYVHGARVDELIAKTDSSGAVYYHQDGLGSTVALTNGSGNLLERYTFDAYGQPSLSDGSGSSITVTGFGNRFLFTGREWLASGSNKLEIYDYRNRVYTPGVGRFLQTDPIGFDAGDANLYRYVFNNSVLNTDPLGLLPEARIDEKGCMAKVVAQYFSQQSATQQMQAMALIGAHLKSLTASVWDQARAKKYSTDGQTNAFRHCLWSCELARYGGQRFAEDFAECHEGTNKSCDTEVDRINNQFGRTLAGLNGSCASLCESRMDPNLGNRGLVLDEKDPRLPCPPCK